MTVLPVASMTVAPAGVFDGVARADGGDAVAGDDDGRSRSDDARSLSKTLPFRMTSDFGAGGVRRRAMASDFVIRSALLDLAERRQHAQPRRAAR